MKNEEEPKKDDLMERLRNTPDKRTKEFIEENKEEMMDLLYEEEQERDRSRSAWRGDYE